MKHIHIRRAIPKLYVVNDPKGRDQVNIWLFFAVPLIQHFFKLNPSVNLLLSSLVTK